MGGQHDLRVNDAALVGVIVGHAVPLICQLLAAPVGGSGYGGFADAPFDDLNRTMKNRYAV